MIDMIRNGFSLWISLVLAKAALVVGLILVLGSVALVACAWVAISEKWRKVRVKR